MRKSLISLLAGLVTAPTLHAAESKPVANPTKRHYHYRYGYWTHHKSRLPMNHAAARRAKIKRRNKRLHPKGCK